ncbi:MAG: hypothetical protein E6Q97_07860 [Desulfurellales bacterium]|nr:MAG: hypothetical protein E6Q97_07860 [Desulfurellales bacterium]
MTTPARYADGTPYLSHGVDATGRPFALLVHQGSAALTRDQLVELREACEAALLRFASTSASRHRSQIGDHVSWRDLEPFHLYIGATADEVDHLAIASMWLADDPHGWRKWTEINPTDKGPVYGGPRDAEVIDNDFAGITLADAKDRFWRWCDANPRREVAKVLRRPMPYNIAASATCTIPSGRKWTTEGVAAAIADSCPEPG